MKDSAWNSLLLMGGIIPLVLLLWPFAQWGDGMSLALRVVPALCFQVLLCRVGKQPAVRLTPLILTGLLALWGIYLYFTSPHWSNATVLGLLADYVSPVIGCAAAWCAAAMKNRM